MRGASSCLQTLARAPAEDTASPFGDERSFGPPHVGLDAQPTERMKCHRGPLCDSSVLSTVGSRARPKRMLLLSNGKQWNAIRPRPSNATAPVTGICDACVNWRIQIHRDFPRLRCPLSRPLMRPFRQNPPLRLNRMGASLMTSLTKSTRASLQANTGNVKRRRTKEAVDREPDNAGSANLPQRKRPLRLVWILNPLLRPRTTPHRSWAHPGLRVYVKRPVRKGNGQKRPTNHPRNVAICPNPPAARGQ